jgi:hypothetical protein
MLEKVVSNYRWSRMVNPGGKEATKGDWGVHQLSREEGPKQHSSA